MAQAARPFVGHMIHDAAVAPFGDVVFQPQFEGAVLTVGANVARIVRINASQRAVLNLPAGAHVFALERVPAVGRFAIEQQLPALGLFAGGKCVWRGCFVGSRFGRGVVGAERWRHARQRQSKQGNGDQLGQG